MKTREKNILIGTILIAFGLFMFFKSTSVYSWGFWRLGPISTGGILIALLLLDVILLVATSAKVCKILIPVLAGLLVLSIILGTQLHFHGTVIDLLLMLVPAAVGAGLVLKGAFTKKEKEE